MIRSTVVRTLFPLLFTLVASGCANTIRVDNRDAITPAGRVTWQAVEPRLGASSGVGWSGLVVHGEVSHNEGKDRQVVPVGEEIALDGAALAGPVTVRARARVVDVTAGVRTGLSVKNIFRLEALAGFEVLHSQLSIVSGGVQLSDQNTAAGILVGARAGVQPHEMIEFYGQYSVGSAGTGRNENRGTSSERIEVGARLLPFEHLGVFAGYRWAEYRQGRKPNESDADLQFRGPVLGAELRF